MFCAPCVFHNLFVIGGVDPIFENPKYKHRNPADRCQNQHSKCETPVDNFEANVLPKQQSRQIINYHR